MASANETDIKFLLNQLQAKIIGASQGQIKAELFDTLREFFNESSSWVETLTINVIANTIEYALVPDVGQILRLAAVVDSNNIPQPAIMPTIGTLQFRNPYNINQVMTAYVVVTCALPRDRDDLPVIPDWVLPAYSEAIQDGVMGKMFNTPQATYSNPKLAQTYHLPRFRNGMAVARADALRRNTFGTQAWRFPGFASGTQRGSVSTASNDRRF